MSNIASEIVKYKKAGMSIVDVPFELKLTEQESLAYGKYYSIDLHGMDIKPQLVGDNTPKLAETTQKVKQLCEGNKKKEKKEKVDNKKVNENEKIQEEITENKDENHSNELYLKGFMPILIKEKKFTKVIFQNINGQDVEYVLHPKADQSILKYEVGTIIEVKGTSNELGRNILCKYEAKQIISPDGTIEENNTEELKEAV